MSAHGAWLILIIAGLLEIVWALALKSSEGLSRLWPAVGAAGAAALSFALLAVALRSIPVGVGYTVWVGIGAVGVMLTGSVLLSEPLTIGRMICLTLVLSGVVGLKLI